MGGSRANYDHEAWCSWFFDPCLDSIALVTHLKTSQSGKETGPRGRARDL